MTDVWMIVMLAAGFGLAAGFVIWCSSVVEDAGGNET